MNTEDEAVIEIEAEPVEIDSNSRESISYWHTAAQVQSALGLNKAALQKAISKLTSIYEIDLKRLRRGNARATEYSQLALDAIELLNAGKFAELRKLLVESTPTTVAASSAIVFVDNHHQIARTAATTADSNLTQINSLKSDLLSNYRELGRALGQQAAEEVRLGFTEQVKAGLANLREA